ncbi:phage scaffolding protein [Streptococcus sp. E29BA]|uniref:phage scaffolding protein n=1 Tax=Streptococcus sp. E29BA TaxID=3278716 RepID=UPI00359E7DBD
MEWLKTIIEKHTTDGATDVEAVMNAVNTEFPKHAVTKAVYNEQADKLKAANETLETLKKSNKDNESLQAELKSYKEKVVQLETEAKETAKKQSIKDALTAAKATDVDYLMYKLGEVEVGEDGQIKDLDNKIKDLQANLPQFFESAVGAKQTDGYKSLGGADLGKGKQPEAQDVATVISNKDVNLTQFLEQQTKGV